MGKSIKIINVVGARPNFIKAAPVVAALQHDPKFDVRLIHTGQHYDKAMSEIFFKELNLPKPNLNLGVGTGSHAQLTSEIMVRFEKIVEEEKPALVIVFGDVNSTIATAIVCSKMGIPIAHVEAGLRSFDRTMPEEINRIVTDQLSSYLFVTEEAGMRNLNSEGISTERIFFVGNVMVDTLLKLRKKALQSSILQQLGLSPREYGVLTLHRPGNVDDKKSLQDVLHVISDVSRRLPVVFPCHPRTQEQIRANKLDVGGIRMIDSLGYLDFLCLMNHAKMVLTDSGGIQEETTVLGIPCLTLRENTERPVTIEHGTNVLVGRSREKIMNGTDKILEGGVVEGKTPRFWDGKSAHRIASILGSSFSNPAL